MDGCLFALLLVKMSVSLVLVHLLKFLGHRNGQHNGAKSLLMPKKSNAQESKSIKSA